MLAIVVNVPSTVTAPRPSFARSLFKIVTAWLTVFAVVNVAPVFDSVPEVAELLPWFAELLALELELVAWLDELLAAELEFWA